MNKNKKISIGIGIIIALVVLLLYLSSPTLMTTSGKTIEGDVNIVNQIYSCNNIICDLRVKYLPNTEQTVFFNTAEFTAGTLYRPTYKVGDTINFYSRSACEYYGTPSLTTMDAKMTIHLKNSDTGATSDVSLTATGITNHASFFKSTTISASKAGTWTAYDEVSCYKSGTTSPILYSSSSSGLTRTFSVTASAPVCPSPKQEGITGSSTSGLSSVNGITCENWAVFSGSSCLPTYEKRNCVTECYTTAYCDNSYSSQSCSGIQSCVKKPMAQCTSDTTQSCSDGTTITTISCTNGIKTETGAICSEVFPEVNPDGTNNPKVDIIEEEDCFVTGTCGDDSTGVNNTSKYILWGMILITIMLVSLIIYKLFKSKK